MKTLDSIMNTMKVSLATVILLFALAASANAAIPIISADFTGATEFVDLTGTAPNLVNAPGNNWVKATGRPSFKSTYTFGNSAPSAFADQGLRASAVELTGSGYTMASDAVITLTADLRPLAGGAGASGSASDGRGLALGFYSALGGEFSQNRFTGLVLDTAGNLNFVNDPNANGFFDAGSTKGTSVAFGGTFDSSAHYTLSYTVDRNNGNISSISLSGSSADYSSLLTDGAGFFTAVNTVYAGFYQSGTTGGTGNYERGRHS